MKKYIKKPVTIEAVQWDGENVAEIGEFLSANDYTLRGGSLYLDTVYGKILCPIGSYIVKNPNGECLPCREDIFTKTYEEYKKSEA